MPYLKFQNNMAGVGGSEVLILNVISVGGLGTPNMSADGNMEGIPGFPTVTDKPLWSLAAVVYYFGRGSLCYNDKS